MSSKKVIVIGCAFLFALSLTVSLNADAICENNQAILSAPLMHAPPVTTVQPTVLANTDSANADSARFAKPGQVAMYPNPFNSTSFDNFDNVTLTAVASANTSLNRSACLLAAKQERGDSVTRAVMQYTTPSTIDGASRGAT